MAVERKTGHQMDCKESNSDLRGKEFYLAKRVANRKFDLAVLGDPVAGVITEGKDVGLHTSIATGNQLKALAGATIAIGDKLTSDANGKVRVAASTHNVFGTAMSAAASGELVEFDMDRGGILA